MSGYNTSDLKFLREAASVPMLTPEDERALVLRWKENGDRRAHQQLIMAHVRMAAKVAKAFARHGVPVADLLQEGNVGLVIAANKFQIEKGFRFATYAAWWVRNCVQTFTFANISIVKLPSEVDKTSLFKYRAIFNRLQQENPDLEDWQVRAMVLEEIDAPDNEIEAIEIAMRSGNVSLNERVGENGEMERQDLLVEAGPSSEDRIADRLEASAMRKMINDALNEFPDKWREIMIRRRLKEDPDSLEEIGNDLGISKERVRQIEVKGLEKLEKILRRRSNGRGLLRTPGSDL